MKRTANLSTAAQDDYKGDRKALSYLGTYNFNLDSFALIIISDIFFRNIHTFHLNKTFLSNITFFFTVEVQKEHYTI